jgi:hypothetical protein
LSPVYSLDFSFSYATLLFLVSLPSAIVFVYHFSAGKRVIFKISTRIAIIKVGVIVLIVALYIVIFDMTQAQRINI